MSANLTISGVLFYSKPSKYLWEHYPRFWDFLCDHLFFIGVRWLVPTLSGGLKGWSMTFCFTSLLVVSFQRCYPRFDNSDLCSGLSIAFLGKRRLFLGRTYKYADDHWEGLP